MFITNKTHTHPETQHYFPRLHNLETIMKNARNFMIRGAQHDKTTQYIALK